MSLSFLQPLLLAATVVLPATASTSAEGGLDLAQYEGKVVLLDFWASWCIPCAESFPWMAEMLERHGADGLVVVAVNVDEDLEAARRFLADRDASRFQHVSDPTGAIAESHGVQAMPTSILYDRRGRPVFVHRGFRVRRRLEYEEHIVSVLQGRTDGASASLPVTRPAKGKLGVRPWRRGVLAQADMRLDRDSLGLATDDHIYFSKEASSGGRGFGGGGCGCN